MSTERMSEERLAQLEKSWPSAGLTGLEHELLAECRRARAAEEELAEAVATLVKWHHGVKAFLGTDLLTCPDCRAANAMLARLSQPPQQATGKE